MNVAIVGAQWGDEGKGKVVDLYSARSEYIVRFQGGNNAGHTLVVNGKKTILHLIPSGILNPGKRCVVANGVVFNPEVFFEEVDSLVKSGALQEKPSELIHISERAHIILPYHTQLDRLREEHASGGKGKIGTTVRGIGPAYEDKVARRGIQAVDLLRPKLLKEKILRAVEEKNVLLRHHYGEKEINVEEIYDQALRLGEKLKPFIRDVRKILLQAVQNGDRILFEGAQGCLLDIDHGTYPYVTSSNVTVGGVLSGCGLGPEVIDRVVGITKAYTTRVGTGPFPTELHDEMGETIRKAGAEFGSTTGRPRRTGWLDLVALKYAVQLNGITGIALMKSDVLDGLAELQVCTDYELAGKTIQDFPACVEDLENVKPVYQKIKGWKKYNARSVKTTADLPQELQDYMSFITDYLNVPICLLSTGPGREETLEIADPFSN